jgi:hypothetical protein
MDIYRVVRTSDVCIYSALDPLGQTTEDIRDSLNSSCRLQAKICSGRWSSDDLLQSMSCEFVVSCRLFDRLQSLRLPPRTRVFDVDVVNCRGRIVGHYKLLDNPHPAYSVVNVRRSKCKFAASVIIAVEDMVVDPERIPQLDLFPIRPSDWMGSQSFARTITDEIAGVRLEPVRMEREGLE